MTPERDDIAHGLRMAGIAVVSAILTATAVIGAGEAWSDRAAPEQAPADAALHHVRADG